VEAGQRTLGETYFTENAGRFWSLVATRPYMHARAGLAECLVDTGKVDEGIVNYKEMLLLNPDDNQGLRYILLNLLIELGRDQEAQELVDAYAEDIDCQWKYNRALLAFRLNGATPVATAALLEALDRNPHVPEYLTGRKRLPVNIPDAIVFGEPSEAQDYANSALNNWRRTPGAIDWLKEHPSPKTTPVNRPRHKPGKKKTHSKRR
jgi:tetratricopeptide (TPR) repeat protein